ncbi:MAG TPA: hypothetical protein VKC57_16745 [Ktedonobacterales bacterium]|nr:hypothetical protein [Ktedonobacterales bacterium]
MLGPNRGVVLPAEEAERLRTLIPDCQVVAVPDTKHYTIIGADLLKQSVISFLGAAS